jgi:glutamate dehydrogenase
MARAALRDDLQVAHAQLTAEVLNGDGGGNGARGLVAAWERQTSSVPEAVKTLRSICAGRPDLARMSVGLRIVRGLLAKPNR